MVLHYSGVPLYSKKLILHVRIENLCSIFQCTLMNYPYPSPAGLSLSICQWTLNCTVTSRDLFLFCTSFFFSLVRHQLILQEQRIILKCLLHCHLIRWVFLPSKPFKVMWFEHILLFQSKYLYLKSCSCTCNSISKNYIYFLLLFLWLHINLILTPMLSLHVFCGTTDCFRIKMYYLWWL